MRLKRALKQLLLGPAAVLKVEFRQYKLATLLTFVVMPALLAIDYFLRGRFVGFVDYMGREVSYIIFISLGVGMSFAGTSIVNAIESVFRRAQPLLFKAEHVMIPVLSVILANLLRDAIYSTMFSLVLFGIAGIDPLKIVEAVILIYVVGLPTLASLGLFLSVLALYFRGKDYRRLKSLVNRVLWIIMPVFYAASLLPNWLTYLPTVSLIEGARRFVLGLGGENLLIYSVVSGLVAFLVAYVLFDKALYDARKTGRIVLE